MQVRYYQELLKNDLSHT